ncbi:hypothetical protein N8664_02550 [Verrucomicrobia bacterium]|nr:hypothetical protein [Verrucomicrobiota bacterium]
MNARFKIILSGVWATLVITTSAQSQLQIDWSAKLTRPTALDETHTLWGVSDRKVNDTGTELVLNILWKSSDNQFIEHIVILNDSGSILTQYPVSMYGQPYYVDARYALTAKPNGSEIFILQFQDDGLLVSQFPYAGTVYGTNLNVVWRSYETPRGPTPLYTIQKSEEFATVSRLSFAKVNYPDQAPQSSISRAGDSITLSTDTLAGQSYRIQSSQDLKQWRDEEIIEGNGEKKSVQRQTDKPKEFLRVVEE